MAESEPPNSIQFEKAVAPHKKGQNKLVPSMEREIKDDGHCPKIRKSKCSRTIAFSELPVEPLSFFIYFRFKCSLHYLPNLVGGQNTQISGLRNGNIRFNNLIIYNTPQINYFYFICLKIQITFLKKKNY